MANKIWALVICMTVVECNLAIGDDWNLWRGPSGDGVAAASGYFGSEPFDLEVIWSKPIGSGYSGVSIVNGQVLTMFTQDRSDFVAAFNVQDGAERWRYRLGPMYRAHDGGHDGPVSTPVADQNAVYALGPFGKLVVLEADTGIEMWSISVKEEFDAREPYWGFCSTPIVCENLVIVQLSGRDEHGIVAFDRVTGEKVWHQRCDATDYRSPVLARIHETPQIILGDQSATVGLEPATGRTIWRYTRGIGRDQSPLPLADGRVLLTDHTGTELIQLDETAASPQRLWRSEEFKGNFDVPVYHEGSFYGFTGRYLTCVDGETGKRRWRSRKPGGKGLTLVDGRLVIFGDHGDLVVAAANNEHYEELARTNVSDAASYPSPSFADETIVVRNLRDLVAVRRTDRSLPRVGDTADRSEFDKFLAKLAESPEKQALIERFLHKHPSLPYIEPRGVANFIYVGDASDVGIRGRMLAVDEEDSMHRVPGTNFFHRSYTFEPGASWEYQFVVDYDRPIADPRNPRKAFDDRNVSEFLDRANAANAGNDESPSGWQVDGQHAGDSLGRLDGFEFRGKDRRFDGPVQVYLPHDYSPKTDVPLFVCLDGEEWIKNGKLTQVMDHLNEDDRVSFVAALVPSRYQGELGGAATRIGTEWLAKELVPEIRKRYGLATKPSQTIILGHRRASVAAVHAALKHPAVFGECIAISFGRADTVRSDQIRELIDRGNNKKPRFHLAWSRYDIRRPQSFDCRSQSRDLRSQLKSHGYPTSGDEDAGGAGWRTWRAQAATAIFNSLSVDE